MPHARTSPPADRFFARLDQFEATCPNCGKLIFARLTVGRHQNLSKHRATHLSPRSRQLREATWNPVCQRLKCPWCNGTYMAGLLLWSVPSGAKRILDPPPDVLPTAREIAVSRLKAGGWWATQAYQRGQHVNVAVVTPCSCPLKGWSEGCPVHGDPAQQRPTP
jgi:hypothetical protein